MSENCVVTFTWMISGHGKVLRYASNREIVSRYWVEASQTIDDEKYARFIPDFDYTIPFERTPNDHNTNYISLSEPRDYAISTESNGWQAQELMFRDVYGISTDSQFEIERKIQLFENSVHEHLHFSWSIFRNFLPWEKAYIGYVEQKEKFRLEEQFETLEKKGKLYEFNRSWDPNVGIDPIGGGFCRLMLINVTNETKEELEERVENNEGYKPQDLFFEKGSSRNYYYGDQAELFDSLYGFNIPKYELFLKEIVGKCWDNSNKLFENHKKDLGDLGNNCTLRICIYDTTCNSYRKWIAPSVQDKLKTEYTNERLAAIKERDIKFGIHPRKGGGEQYGGNIDVAKEMAFLKKDIKEEFENMTKTVDDPYKVTLNILLDMKELAEKKNQDLIEKGASSSSSSS
jgi:hypothetical protein